MDMLHFKDLRDTESNFSVEDDIVNPTTVEFNKKITTEVQNLHVAKIN